MLHDFDGARPDASRAAFVAGSADVCGKVVLGELSSVWYGAVLRGDVAPITIGALTNIQDGSVVHVSEGRPCVLGEGVTVGHRAVVHACDIGSYSLIGMGAIVLDGAKIGEECIVGAGSLVTQNKSFPPGSMILGSPAKVLRELTAEERSALHDHAAAYVELARRTAEGAAGAGDGAVAAWADDGAVAGDDGTVAGDEEPPKPPR